MFIASSMVVGTEDVLHKLFDFTSKLTILERRKNL